MRVGVLSVAVVSSLLGVLGCGSSSDSGGSGGATSTPIVSPTPTPAPTATPTPTPEPTATPTPTATDTRETTPQVEVVLEQVSFCHTIAEQPLAVQQLLAAPGVSYAGGVYTGSLTNYVESWGVTVHTQPSGTVITSWYDGGASGQVHQASGC